MKLLFTGGHHNSALALAEYMQEAYQAEILWVGHKYSMLGDTSVTAEYKEVTKSGIPFKNLSAGKVYKTLNPIHWLRLPLGFIQGFIYVLQFRPDLIVSFGGYLAVPIVIVGWLLGIPSVSHEQTVAIGLANKLIARFAQKIFITWPESTAYFPKDKIIMTGLPLRKVLFEETSRFAGIDAQKPTLYITGGKQGAHVINQAVSEVLEKLLEEFNVIHQSGSSTVFNDFENLKHQREELPKTLQRRYVLRDYIYKEEIGSVFASADVVISRAGAHTVYELVVLGKPAILIPIPWVSHNEQFKNAQVLADKGSAVVLLEKDLSGNRLLQTILDVNQNIDAYKGKAEQAKDLVEHNATAKMAESIIDLVNT